MPMQFDHQQGAASYYQNPAFSNPTGYHNPNFFRQQNCMPYSQDIQNLRQNVTQGFFFESTSKYISLKNHRKQNDCYIESLISSSSNSHQTVPIINPVFDHQVEKGLRIKEWFEKLPLSDKSVVLTIVDQQLVDLIFRMYNMCMDNGNGKFTNTDYPEDEPHEFLRVKNYDLLFKKPKDISKSERMVKVQQAEDVLIQAVRLVNINQKIEKTNKNEKKKSEDMNSLRKKNKKNNIIQYYDSLTLDLGFFSSNQYFFEIMKYVNSYNPFLQNEQQITKESSFLNNSVFYQCEQNNDTRRYSYRNSDYNLQDQPKKFFTTVPSCINCKQEQHKDCNHSSIAYMSLGQCLMAIFEKAINIQFQEYLNKLNPQQLSYFFIDEPVFNIYLHDQLLTKYWIRLKNDKKQDVIKVLDDIEKQLEQEDHKPLQICSKIQECQFEEDDNISNEYDNDYYDNEYDDIIHGRNNDSDFSDDIEMQRHIRNYGSTSNQYFMDYERSQQKKKINKKPKENHNLLQSQHKFYFQKQEILKDLKKDFKQVKQTFEFIKSLSTFVTLENLRKEQNLDIKEKFYEYLIIQEENGRYDELNIDLNDKKTEQQVKLIQEPVQNSQPKESQQKSNKKNKKKKKKNKGGNNGNHKDEKEAQNKELIIESKSNFKDQISNKYEESKKKEEDAFKIIEFELQEIKNNIKETKLNENKQEIKLLEERTALLTGIVQHNKYQEELENTNTSENNYLEYIYEPENKLDQDVKKKKRKKNKKNKQKNKQNKETVQSMNNEIKLQNNQHDDNIELETIELEQIQCQIEEIFASMPQSVEDKKINNFVEEVEIIPDIQPIQTEVIQVNENEVEQKLNEDTKENDTKELILKVTSSICEQVIRSFEPKEEKIEKKQVVDKKKKNNKKNKKQQQQRQIIKDKETKDNQEQEESKTEILPLNNQNLLLLQQNERQNQLNETIQETSKERQKKVVCFRILRETQENDDEQLKVPKRGSSRGSSCTEEVIHQNTINSLVDLFPNEYKNPSLDTKIRISEITSSQNTNTCSPDEKSNNNTTSCFSLTPSTCKKATPQSENQHTTDSKSLETFTNQNKKRGHHQNHTPQINTSQSQQLLSIVTHSQSKQSAITPKAKTNNQQNFKAEQQKKSHLSPQVQYNKNNQKQKKTKKNQQYENYEAMFQSNYEPISKSQQITLALNENEQKFIQNQESIIRQEINTTQQSDITKQKKIGQHNNNEIKIVNVDNQEQSKRQIPAYQQQKTKNKILVNQQSLSKQSLNPMNFDQRSQTPNVELKIEPLSGNLITTHKRNNMHNQKSQKHQQQKGKQQKKRQNNQMQYAQNQQQCQPQIDQMIAFDQQQMQQQQIPQFFMHQPYLMPFPFIPPQYMMPQQTFQEQPQIFPLQIQSQYDPLPISQLNSNDQQTNDSSQSFTRKNSQHTQTDETRILETDPKQPQVVMNQFQNINVQLHLPPPSMNPFIQHSPQAYQQQMQYLQQYQQQIPIMQHSQTIVQPIQNFKNNQGIFPNFMNGLDYQQQFANQQFLQAQPNVYLTPQMLGLLQPIYQQPLINVNQQSLFQPQPVNFRPNFGNEKEITNKEEYFFFKFDQEIYQIQQEIKYKLQQTDIERQTAFKCIESCVQETFQEFSNVKIQMYGSMASGLAIDSSDMDILVSGVFNNKNEPIDRILLIEQMKKLHKSMNNLYCLESNSIIETATIPVIKIVMNFQFFKVNQILDIQKIREFENPQDSTKIDEDMKHLKIDITFNELESEYQGYNNAQPLHMGIKCCHFIKQKLLEFPNLEPLALILKKFLALRNLNSPFLGGLSSYGLILLIIAFIKSDYPQIYGPNGLVQTSRVLSSFFYYFGNIFDPNILMVNEYTKIVQQMNFSSILIILDPLNPTNNIGKSTYNFDQIKQEFHNAYDKIVNSYQEFCNQQESQQNSDEEENRKKLKILKKVLYLENSNTDDLTQQ